MKKHTLTLLGGAAAVPASMVHAVLGALLTGARGAAWLRVFGERDQWLDEVCAIAVTSLAGGQVQLQAPAFEPNVHPLAGQHDEAHPTAIDCFADVLAAALSGERESLLADRSLLDSCVSFSRACPAGLELVRSNGVALTVRPTMSQCSSTCVTSRLGIVLCALLEI